MGKGKGGKTQKIGGIKKVETATRKKIMRDRINNMEDAGRSPCVRKTRCQIKTLKTYPNIFKKV